MHNVLNILVFAAIHAAKLNIKDLFKSAQESSQRLDLKLWIKQSTVIDDYIMLTLTL